MSGLSTEEKANKKWAERICQDLNEKEKYVLSKIDGLYNVLVTLATFIVGLIISQHNFFILDAANGRLLFLLSAIVISLLVSYGIGFHGMIKTSFHGALRYRILSWSVLLTSLIYFTLIAIGSVLLNSLILTNAILAVFSGQAILCGLLVSLIEWRFLKVLDFDYTGILDPFREGFIAAGIAFMIFVVTTVIWFLISLLIGLPI